MPAALVLGATGRVGGLIADALERRGAEVRRASRRAHEHPVDLRTGAGLEAALAGVEVVVDASNGPPSAKAAAVLVDGTRRLLAAGAAAGVRHHVCLSIVGIDRVPLAYYGVKREQERLVEAGPLPWTIVRSTQFHELIDEMLGPYWRRMALLGAARFQPAAAAEVAEAVAGAALAEPRRDRIDVAGPEILTLRDLARRRPGTRLPLALPIPGGYPGAARAGRLTSADPDVRTEQTFGQWAGSRG